MKLNFMDAIGKQRVWLGPEDFILNEPEPLDSLGLASLNGMLYVFGGYDISGGESLANGDPPVTMQKFIKTFRDKLSRLLCTHGNNASLSCYWLLMALPLLVIPQELH